MPHKLRNLWPQIADYDALRDAWREVRQRKTTKPLILRYESNLAVNLGRLERALQDGSYKPKRHFEFWIHDPKARLIQAPCLEDRIVQHAVCNVLRMPVQQRLIEHTYSCLIGRGTHRCSEQFLEYLDNPRWRYALKLDISKFFYSIDHACLTQELERIIGCRKTLDLLQLFITANGDTCGIPIGASTSQILANLALNPLDHFAPARAEARHLSALLRRHDCPVRDGRGRQCRPGGHPRQGCRPEAEPQQQERNPLCARWRGLGWLPALARQAADPQAQPQSSTSQGA
jgi:RNA-directed DNA polymerase